MSQFSSVIIGAHGFIGSALAGLLPEAKRCARADIDLTCLPVLLPRADRVYICAGVNGPLACARDPQGSWAVNVDGTIELAKRYPDAHVTWISSTTVEWMHDLYAEQRRYTEAVLRTMPHVSIVRAGRVTANNVRNLCVAMIDMRAGELRVWNRDEQPYQRMAA